MLASHPDKRAHLAEQLLAVPRVDLEQLEQLATFDDPAVDAELGQLRALHGLALPARQQVEEQVAQLSAALREIADLDGTAAAGARLVARLLHAALQHRQHHPDQPCPVCGGRALDDQWASDARTRAAELTAQATQLDCAHQSQHQARDQLRQLLPAVPAVLNAEPARDGPDHRPLRSAWQEVDQLLQSAELPGLAAELLVTYDALAAALSPVRAAVDQRLADRHQSWLPVARALCDWVETARRSRLADDTYKATAKAVTWLVSVGKEIRNQRLAPLAGQATEVWRQLRQDSNVDLYGVRLDGTGTQRRVDLHVAVDGEPGAALGVMSQGELHALALSLFLPRATMPASPFRFLVIDDPVQSMDPSKVYGLAKVLQEVAETGRQVIVFTHDDRLPAAIRHLGINAHLRVVSRQERSRITVALDRHGDPALRYLDDAWAVARDGSVEQGIQAKAVCVLIRDAVEARCHDVLMGRAVRAGRPTTEVEQALSRIHKLRSTLALALFDDAGQDGELDQKLGRFHTRAPQLLRQLNKGVHGEPVYGPLTALVEDARELIQKLGGAQ